jgi:hypothetical protein
MKKTILLLVVTFITSLSFSQESLKNHKKIYFEYKIRSTIEYKDNGLYIDLQILEWDFPDLVYEEVIINNKTLGFVKIENIPKKIKRLIISKVFHTTINMIYKFNISTQEYTKEFYFHCDDKTREIYEVLNSNCSESNKIITNAHESEYLGDYKFHITEWVEPNFGFYIDTHSKVLFKNLVEFDKNLPKFITPSVHFDNNQYGVKKIYSTYHTTELIDYRFD